MTPEIGHGSRLKLGRTLKNQSDQIDQLTKTVNNLTTMFKGMAEAIAELKVQPEPPEP